MSIHRRHRNNFKVIPDRKRGRRGRRGGGGFQNTNGPVRAAGRGASSRRASARKAPHRRAPSQRIIRNRDMSNINNFSNENLNNNISSQITEDGFVQNGKYFTEDAKTKTAEYYNKLFNSGNYGFNLKGFKGLFGYSKGFRNPDNK